MLRIIKICAFLTIATVCFADYDIVGLSLNRDGGNTVLEAMTSGPTDIKTSILQKPDRLIVDFIGGVHRLKAEHPALPPGIVAELRTAQFQSTPKPITRIVLVLAEPIADVKIENGPRSGKIFISTPKYPTFKTWSLGRETPKKGAPSETSTEASDESKKPAGQSGAAKPSGAAVLPTVGDTIRLDTLTFSGDSTKDSSRIKATFIRQEVKYKGKGNRDPFVESKESFEIRLGQEEIPAVEGLLLVGVVKGMEDDRLAVMQDNRGWGYIMGVGDSVKEGNVSQVSDSTVTFTINEFGVPRPVTLELFKEAGAK